MKIYNKKGFILGMFSTLLGVSNIITHLVSPKDFIAEQIKVIVIAAVLIIIGVSELIIAFSKEATKEDLIEEEDERNHLVKLKTKSLTLNILYGCLTVTTAAGLVGYELTSRSAWISIFTVAGVLLGILLIVEIIVGFYYERQL